MHNYCSDPNCNITLPNTIHWCWEGKLHRIEGPALIGNDIREWYRFGKLHREDGPAAEWLVINNFLSYELGYQIQKLFYLEGKLFSESEYRKEINRQDNEALKFP